VSVWRCLTYGYISSAHATTQWVPGTVGIGSQEGSINSFKICLQTFFARSAKISLARAYRGLPCLVPPARPVCSSLDRLRPPHSPTRSLAHSSIIASSTPLPQEPPQTPPAAHHCSVPHLQLSLSTTTPTPRTATLLHQVFASPSLVLPSNPSRPILRPAVPATKSQHFFCRSCWFVLTAESSHLLLPDTCPSLSASRYPALSAGSTKLSRCDQPLVLHSFRHH